MGESGQPEYNLEHWLEIIGRSDYLTKTVSLRRGGSVAVRNFPTVCPEGALGIFAELEATSPQDHEYGDMVAVAQLMFDNHFGDQIAAVDQIK